MKQKESKKKKKKKRGQSTDSPPPLVNFFNDRDSDSNDDSRIECYQEPKPCAHYEHFDPFSRKDMNTFNSTQQPESDEDQQNLNEDQSISFR